MTTHNEEMEAKWGQAATYTEYRINDRIRYTKQGQTDTGTIVWVCAPLMQTGQSLPMRYIVQPDSSAGCTETVLPGNIVIDEQSQPADCPQSRSALSEQALIELLASLSLPLIISTDVADDGKPYYIWQVGASSPKHPWGLYVGTHRELSGAVKLGLERALKHMQEHPFPT